MLHIALTVELRSSNPARKFNASRQELVSHADMLRLASAHVQSIVNDLYVLLKENYDTDFTLYDLYEASVLMMTRAVSSQMSSITYDQIGAILGSDLQKLLDNIVQSVENTYCIDLNNESFLIKFAFHLKNLLLRLENDIQITNLQFESIKTDYPLIYAISVHISNVIYQFTCLLYTSAGTADKAFFIRQRKEFQLVSGPRPILMGDAEILHGCIQFMLIKRIHAAGMHHRTAAQ